MAKEYTVAEYGHEERRSLGKNVGMGKHSQIKGATKLSKNEIAVAEIKQDSAYCSISVKKAYKEKKVETKRQSKSKIVGRKSNARKRARQNLDNAIFVEETNAWLEV